MTDYRLVEWLERQVAYLLSQSVSKRRQVMVYDVASTASSFLLIDERRVNDCFALKFSYACSTISWKFMFCHDMPQEPPVIIFDEGLDVDLDSVEVYRNWNGANESQLFTLLECLIHLFKAHHVELCQAESRFQIQLESLENFKDDFEVMVMRQAMDLTNECLFVFYLDFPELSQLPCAFSSDEEMRIVILKVNYTSNDLNTAELCLPSFLSGLFPTHTNVVALPAFFSLLVDYVEEIRKLFPNSIRTACASLNFRKHFLERFRQKMDAKTIDGDFVFWTTCSFLISQNQSDYVINVWVLETSSASPSVELQVLPLADSKSEPLDKLVWDAPGANMASDMDELVQRFKDHVETVLAVHTADLA